MTVTDPGRAAVNAMEPLGTAEDAVAACLGDDHRDDHDEALMWEWMTDGVRPSDVRWHKRCIGSGESRTVWLVNGVVYKVGRHSANRYEHEVLTAWREAGAEWAPRTALYEVEVDTGVWVTEVVVAMEYLPDDRSEGNEADLAAIRVAAPETCPENWVTVDGRTYLIDGGDVERMPAG